jgi:hypothetical protein
MTVELADPKVGFRSLRIFRHRRSFARRWGKSNVARPGSG